MDMLVLIIISRKTGMSFYVLMHIRHVQIGKNFSRCTMQGREMCDKPDWIHIFHLLTFCRSNSFVTLYPISDVCILSQRKKGIFQESGESFCSSKFLAHLRLNWILVVWTYIQVSFRRWGSWYNVLKWKLFQLWNTITYQATKDAEKPLYLTKMQGK